MGYDWFCSGRESWLARSQGKLWLCFRKSDKCSPGRIQDSLQNRREHGRSINDGQKSKGAATADKETVRKCEGGGRVGDSASSPVASRCKGQAQAATHASLYPITMAAAEIAPYYNTLVQLGCGDNRIIP